MQFMCLASSFCYIHKYFVTIIINTSLQSIFYCLLLEYYCLLALYDRIRYSITTNVRLAKANSSNCSLEKWSVTAGCFCRTVLSMTAALFHKTMQVTWPQEWCVRIPEHAGKSHHNPICRLSNVAILVLCKRKHHYFKWSFSNPLVIS